MKTKSNHFKISRESNKINYNLLIYLVDILFLSRFLFRLICFAKITIIVTSTAKASAPTNPQIILKGTLEVDSSMK